MISLIVLDVFGTLIGPLNNIEFRRPKVYEFLDMNPDAIVTFYTDAPERDSKEMIIEGMEDLGILPRLREPFFYGESMDKRHKKHLSKVAKEFGFDIEDVVMIGDSQKDIESAKKYGSRLVIVPDDKSVPVMPMDTIGNLDELLKDHKAARFFYENGTFQHVLGDYEENQRPKGEYLIIEKPQGGLPNSFFEGLRKFQYGETAEESDQGFEQMRQVAEKKLLEKKDDSESE